MSETIVYHYPKCSTCRKALKWLDENEISYSPVHIVENTPDSVIIKNLIEKSGLPVRKFFNTSGMRYRELGLKDRLDSMTLDEASNLLSGDGMLIKRPLLSSGGKVLVGFNEELWVEAEL